jgi:hypothetical protein
MLSACNNNSEQNTDPSIVTGDVEPSEFSANTYLLDSWREDAEDGSRSYYITLLMYSDDYYACPTTNDVKYKTGKEYQVLTNAIEGAEVTLYQVNTELKSGICTYAKIKTPALLDTKKLYVYLAGPIEYDENTLTEEAYKAQHGSLDGWRKLLTRVSKNSPPNEDVVSMQTSINSGVIRLCDEHYTQYYYSSQNPHPVVDGNRSMTKITIDPMKEEGTLENLATHLTQYGGVALIKNDIATTTELDARLRVVYEIIDNELWLGFETVDGSDISTYDGDIPNAISYTYDKTYYLLLN